MSYLCPYKWGCTEKYIREREIQEDSPGIIQWKYEWVVFLEKKKNGCKIGDKGSFFLILLLTGSLIWGKLFNLSEF